jgi:NADH-quinone oxidoreductase subunit M
LYRVTHGAPTPAVAGIGGLMPGEVVSWAPLIVLALAVGLVPAAVLGMAHDAVQVLAP